MDPAEFIEFLKCLSILGVQWVVEWWCITYMVNCASRITVFLWLGFTIALTILHVTL